MYIHTYTHTHLHVTMEQTSPKIQARDLGKQMVSFQTMYVGLRTSRLDGIVPVQRLAGFRPWKSGSKIKKKSGRRNPLLLGEGSAFQQFG